MQVILASQSLGRKKILESLGLSFKAIPSDIDETKFNISKPIALAQTLAKAKAEKVAKKLPHHLIIAADSMVVLGNKVIGKPKDKKDAKRILKSLSGKTHFFITGLYVINTKTNKTWQKFSKSKVTFRKLTDEKIDAYIKRTDVTRFAGGYAVVPFKDFNLKNIQKGKTKIIKKIDGSLTNVLGLPLEILLPILRENGIRC